MFLYLKDTKNTAYLHKHKLVINRKEYDLDFLQENYQIMNIDQKMDSLLTDENVNVNTDHRDKARRSTDMNRVQVEETCQKQKKYP